MKDKDPIGYMIRDEIRGKLPKAKCPVCKESDYEVRHRQGDGYLPETTWKQCNNCEHEWDHQ